MELIKRAFFQVPIVGWLAKDALRGLPEAKYYFAANLAIVFAFLVWKIGYPFVIITALTGTAAGLTLIVILTAGDLFGRKSSSPEQKRPARHARAAGPSRRI